MIQRIKQLIGIGREEDWNFIKETIPAIAIMSFMVIGLLSGKWIWGIWAALGTFGIFVIMSLIIVILNVVLIPIILWSINLLKKTGAYIIVWVFKSLKKLNQKADDYLKDLEK
mgnify:CR=1 FL=1